MQLRQMSKGHSGLGEKLGNLGKAQRDQSKLIRLCSACNPENASKRQLVQPRMRQLYRGLESNDLSIGSATFINLRWSLVVGLWLSESHDAASLKPNHAGCQ